MSNNIGEIFIGKSKLQDLLLGNPKISFVYIGKTQVWPFINPSDGTMYTENNLPIINEEDTKYLDFDMIFPSITDNTLFLDTIDERGLSTVIFTEDYKNTLDCDNII